MIHSLSLILCSTLPSTTSKIYSTIWIKYALQIQKRRHLLRHNTESLLVIFSVVVRATFLRSCTATQQSISLLLLDQQVSLYPSNLSHHPSRIPHWDPSPPLLLSSPLISFHSHIDSARWLSRDPFLHIHHCPYSSLSISDTVVRIEFQIPRPSRLSLPSRSPYSPASFPF